MQASGRHFFVFSFTHTSPAPSSSFHPYDVIINCCLHSGKSKIPSMNYHNVTPTTCYSGGHFGLWLIERLFNSSKVDGRLLQYFHIRNLHMITSTFGLKMKASWFNIVHLDSSPARTCVKPSCLPARPTDCWVWNFYTYIYDVTGTGDNGIW